jgi:hypothetical protein
VLPGRLAPATLAARLADLDSPGSGRPPGRASAHAWLRFARVTDDARATAAGLGSTFGAGPDQVLASPIVLIGSAAEIVERLHERRDRWGYSYYTIQQRAAMELAPVPARLAG